jgi:MFS family permease
MTSPADTTEKSGTVASTTWGTLRHKQFKALWSSGGIYFIGNAMQTMAASWMMVQISGSSFLAALVQTAVFLPMFLLSLPAGVWADITDRRQLILAALGVQTAAGVLLTVLMLFHVGGAGTLLFMIFICGSCTALLSPAWNSTVSDSVPRAELPQAITVISIAYNAARAVGPALAGLVFTVMGGAWNFALAVLSSVVMMLAVRRYPPKPHPPSRLPPERLWGGMVSAVRFARHSQTVLAQLVRTVAFSAAGCALWALLPAIGKQQLELQASGFGLLMGCLGGGAVTVGFFIGRLRSRMGLERLVQAACVAYALMMLVTAFSRWDWPVYPALFIAGAAWMAAMSTFNTATQTSVPPWVRARAVAMHTLSALGSFAVGSAIWGAMADLVGLSSALCVAAIAMLAGLLLAKPFPLRMGEAQEVTQANAWQELFITHEPAP